MSVNAIAISRSLSAAGLESQAADAVAEAIVTHSDEHLATKTDIVRLDGEIKSLAMLVKVNLGLTLGLYIGIAVLFVEKLSGSG